MVFSVCVLQFSQSKRTEILYSAILFSGNPWKLLFVVAQMTHQNHPYPKKFRRVFIFSPHFRYVLSTKYVFIIEEENKLIVYLPTHF